MTHKRRRDVGSKEKAKRMRSGHSSDDDSRAGSSAAASGDEWDKVRISFCIFTVLSIAAEVVAALQNIIQCANHLVHLSITGRCSLAGEKIHITTARGSCGAGPNSQSEPDIRHVCQGRRRR
jgi:hypothetical protein